MAEKSIFNQWSNVVSESRNELVFADRNKAYGAYEIRKRYNRTVTMALIITISSFAVIVSIPAIIDWVNSQKEEEVVAAAEETGICRKGQQPNPCCKMSPPPPRRSIWVYEYQEQAKYGL